MKPSILLVDDNPALIQMMGSILADLGELRIATNGQDALIRMRETAPDLVLLDAEMPGMGGFEVCAVMQADAALVGIPIIFVTGHGGPELELKGLQAGAVDFIAKPVNGPLLIARVKTHLRIGQIAAAERREMDMLRDSFNDLEQFNYAAVHDIKAPLRNISSLLGFVRSDYGDRLPDDGKSMLDRADRAALQLSHLIDSLLAHATSNSAAMERCSVELTATIADILDSMHAILADSAITVTIENELGTVTGDPVLVRQLLANLIGNAVKYRASHRNLQVRIRREQDTGTLIIRDNGIGFDNDMREKIFEPFKRLHAGRDIEGSGIGLSTCKKICERHGWTLTAEGRPGNGAAFRIGL